MYPCKKDVPKGDYEGSRGLLNQAGALLAYYFGGVIRSSFEENPAVGMVTTHSSNKIGLDDLATNLSVHVSQMFYYPEPVQPVHIHVRFLTTGSENA